MFQCYLNIEPTNHQRINQWTTFEYKQVAFDFILFFLKTCWIRFDKWRFRSFSADIQLEFLVERGWDLNDVIYFRWNFIQKYWSTFPKELFIDYPSRWMLSQRNDCGPAVHITIGQNYCRILWFNQNVALMSVGDAISVHSTYNITTLFRKRNNLFNNSHWNKYSNKIHHSTSDGIC